MYPIAKDIRDYLIAEYNIRQPEKSIDGEKLDRWSENLFIEFETLDVVLANIEHFHKMSKKELCDSCNNNEGKEKHGCPFKEEIHDDYEFQCNCCEECRVNCLYEI